MSAHPKHVAIIMDGNRRWAEKKGLPIPMGHAEGVTALYRTVRAAATMGIETLTVFGFSTENWQRSLEEVDSLVHLVGESAVRFRESMVADGIRMSTIGDLTRFPPEVRKCLEDTCTATAACEKLHLVLAVSYGARNDIVRAVRRLATEVEPERITEELLASYLDTAPWSEPDVVVRTSGEMRLSNFLLWQVAYSEITVLDVLWPDFGADHLRQVVETYQNRERRHGN